MWKPTSFYTVEDRWVYMVRCGRPSTWYAAINQVYGLHGATCNFKILQHSSCLPSVCRINTMFELSCNLPYVNCKRRQLSRINSHQATVKNYLSSCQVIVKNHQSPGNYWESPLTKQLSRITSYQVTVKNQPATIRNHHSSGNCTKAVVNC